MKILYDHQAFSLQEFGGVSRYFHELLSHASPDLVAELPLVFSNNIYLRDRQHTRHREFFPKLNFRGRFRLMRYINHRAAVEALRRQDFDVFHPTLNDDPYFLSLIGDKPFVLTIHDMIPALFPEFYPDRNLADLEHMARRAARIIAISETTRADVIRLLDLDPERVSVVYHGYSPLNYPSTPLPKQLPPRYLLYAGSRAFYKNFACLMEAFAQLAREVPDVHLVCAGGGGFTPQEKTQIEVGGVTDRVHALGTVTDGQLNDLYRGAAAFVYPSLYEGFGLPILEAFGQGCPVVLSRASCFPEIAQDAALYFEPNQPESLCQELAQLLNDDALRARLIRMGELRVRDFTWQEAARRTRQVYEEARAEMPAYSY